MKKGILRIAALLVLMLAINISIIYAEEAAYEYVSYELYDEEATAADIIDSDAEVPTFVEPVWQPIMANVLSDGEFFFRIEGGATINYVNEDGWHWLVLPWHLVWLERAGFDTSYFRNLEEAMSSIPQLEYLFSTWGWGPEIIVFLDMPALELRANANARIEFDFYMESLMVLSWGGEAIRDAVTVGGLITPGTSVTLPGASSFTAIYFHVAYGPGRPIEYGHVLLLIEVPGIDGRSAPAYSLNPEDHIPSDFAVLSIYRANELGILPEFFDRSLRRPISRLDFATLAVYLHETVMQREIAGRASFNDTVDVNAGKMGFLGVMTENEFGNFSPSNHVTREQTALLIVRLATVSGLHLPVVERQLADVEHISGWARDAVMQVIGAGIMSAPYGYFDPSLVPTREEVIVMMVRLFEMLRG